jgi:hypothetical protein
MIYLPPRGIAHNSSRCFTPGKEHSGGRVPRLQTEEGSSEYSCDALQEGISWEAANCCRHVAWQRCESYERLCRIQNPVAWQGTTYITTETKPKVRRAAFGSVTPTPP